MPETLVGRRILVAGGSGGLGSEAVVHLASEGAAVVAGYRTNAPPPLPEGCSAVRADITVPADRARLLDAAPDLFGLAVFAGEPARVSGSDQFEEAVRRSHDVNFLGPILLAREAAERMRRAGTPGAIVLVSSMQAVALFPGSTAYAAPKAALIHAARILAKECRGPANIRVNVVSPGVTEAGMARASIAAGKYDRFLSDGAIPRFGRAADIARAVRFLLEPDNYITGQVLTVDGGLTL